MIFPIIEQPPPPAPKTTFNSPIETTFFMEDAKVDPVKFNRFYFKFPGNWITSNNGETVIGLRSIYMAKSKRKIEFKLIIIKYLKKTLKDAIAKWGNKPIDYYMRRFFKPGNIVDGGFKRTVYMSVIVNPEDTIEDINDKLNKTFKAFTISAGSVFSYNEDDILDRDIMFECYYDKNGMHEKIYAPRNLMENDDYGITFKLLYKHQEIEEAPLSDDKKEDLTEAEYEKMNQKFFDDLRKDNEVHQTKADLIILKQTKPNGEMSKAWKELLDKHLAKIAANNKLIEKYTYKEFDTTEIDQDFIDIFNIGTENDIKKCQKKYITECVFNNIWDRNPCEIYASFAEQSLHNYVGNTDRVFNPIKYYKPKASDQRFWIELYSEKHNFLPIKMPPREGFRIDMQFLPFEK